MNLSLLSNLWSFKKELLLILFSFIVILSLPIKAVIIFANTGINVVSDTLVRIDVRTHSIELSHLNL